MMSEDARHAVSGDTGGRDVPVRVLTTRLGERLARLIREEADLVKAEMFASARQALLGGGLLGGAAVVGLGAWLAMVTTAIAGIAEGLPVWAPALIIGDVLGTLAGVLALLGRRRLARGVPRLTMTAGSLRREIGELAGGRRR